MDLADFPRLKCMKFPNCPLITGNLGDIGEKDFSKLEVCALGYGVTGDITNGIQRISDVPEVAKGKSNPPTQKKGGNLHLKVGIISLDSLT